MGLQIRSIIQISMLDRIIKHRERKIIIIISEAGESKGDILAKWKLKVMMKKINHYEIKDGHGQSNHVHRSQMNQLRPSRNLQKKGQMPNIISSLHMESMHGAIG